MRSQVRVSTGSLLTGWFGRYRNVRRCGELSLVFLQLIASLELEWDLGKWTPLYYGHYHYSRHSFGFFLCYHLMQPLYYEQPANVENRPNVDTFCGPKPAFWSRTSLHSPSLLGLEDKPVQSWWMYCIYSHYELHSIPTGEKNLE